MLNSEKVINIQINSSSAQNDLHFIDNCQHSQ